VKEAWRLADLHAYVDDCLEPDERSAFEKQMAEDPALARRAAMWRAQNSAIRSAFDGEGPKAFSISIVRHQNDIQGKGRRPASAAARTSREPPSRSHLQGVEDVPCVGAKLGVTAAIRPLLSWRLSFAALFACLVCVWSPSAPVFPARGLGEAAVAAFRAFALPGVVVDFATANREEAQGWLASRLSHPVYIPATPFAVSLVGARIAAYPGAPGALLIYKSQETLVGLLVRSLDAPAARAPELLPADGRNAAVWTWRGQGFALVGDLEGPSLLKIATDFFDPTVGGVQAAPDRGSYGL
jgi:anti-sigma factor RsiW